MADSSHILLVGIGSPHGDDQIGWRVADELVAALSKRDRQEWLDTWRIHKAKSPLDLLNWLEADSRGPVRHLIICDACQSASSPADICAGAIHCWSWPDEELPSVRFSGSHDLGLAAVLHLARALDRLPPRIDIWGVEVDRLERATDLSSQLKRTPALVARRIRESTAMNELPVSWI